MPELYRRRIMVTVAGLEISDVRISFGISRRIDGSQDTGEVRLWNLRDERERRIRDRGGAIEVSAGYPETIAQLFAGDVQRVIRERRDHARITLVEMGDRVRGAKTVSGVYQASYSGQVAVRVIATDIVERGLGLEPGPLDPIPASAMARNFYWAGASAAAALSALLRPHGLTWFESDGVVRFNGRRMVQSDAPTVTVTPETGLIGSPVETDEGAELRVFLNPEITLGSTVELESETLEGRWKAVEVEHAGDNWTGGKFETRLTLRAL